LLGSRKPRRRAGVQSEAMDALTGFGYLFLFLAAFAGMEGVAWLMHKYLMHGPLWVLHESHHRPRTGWFEKNDLFGIFFSVPSIVLIYLGTHGTPGLLAVGLGMTAYGMAYFGFHDVIVHRRVSVSFPPAGRYLQRITKAHLVHHKTTRKEGAVSFGFLWAPRTYGS
jgi:beta-carotene 3-hydroxylase